MNRTIQRGAVWGGVLAIFIVLLSLKSTEIVDQMNRMSGGQKIFSAPIPSEINFAGEDVLLDKLEVRERLDREMSVNTYWQSNTLLIAKRSKKIFEVIEPILAKHGVPDDFKYLAVAESGLLNVTSSAGAKGVWQFMKSSGKAYGLQIDDQVDERYHLEKSTEAACVYLKEAYGRFGSWSLAAAAYNRGMAGIQRDLDKQKVSSYYDLHLNSETARYLFRILAFKSILSHPEAYGFMIEDMEYYDNPSTQTVLVDSTIANLAQYAQRIGSNYHVIKTLNPWILGNELQVKQTPYTIKAPLIE